MSQLIKLSVYTRRGQFVTGAPTFGFDVEDIVSPIKVNPLTGKSIFTARMLKGTPAGMYDHAKVEYQVNDSLASIAAQTSKLLPLTVVSRRGIAVSSVSYLFVSSRISENIVPTAAGGARFFYCEDGDPSPVDYEVVETVSDIVAIDSTLTPQSSQAQKSFVMSPGNTLFAVGDSITEASALPSNQGYIYILGSATGTTVNNKAVSGRGAYRAIANAYQYNPGNSGKWISSWMAGFNDYRRSATAKTREKCKGALTAFIVNAFMKNAVTANLSTKTGTWGNLATGAIGDLSGYLSGNPIFSSNVGATAQFSFTGTNVCVGTWGVDGVSEFGGVFQVEIDNVVVGTYNNVGKTDGVSDGADSNTRTPSALVFKNLSSGSHTLKITVMSIQPSGNVYVDYVATLNEPQSCPTVLVYDIPKMNAAGYATIPNQASDAVFNAGDDIQKEVVDMFPEYPVVIVKTNDAYSVTTGLLPDNIHPNALGNSQIASVSLLGLAQSQGGGSSSAILINSTNTPQTADYNISGTGRANLLRSGNGFFYNSFNVLSVSGNRNPVDGSLSNAALPCAIIQMETSVGNGNIKFFTANYAGGFDQVLTINSTGDIEQAAGRWIYLSGGKENVDGSIRIGVELGAFVKQKRITGVWTTQP